MGWGVEQDAGALAAFFLGAAPIPRHQGAGAVFVGIDGWELGGPAGGVEAGGGFPITGVEDGGKAVIEENEGFELHWGHGGEFVAEGMKRAADSRWAANLHGGEAGAGGTRTQERKVPPPAVRAQPWEMAETVKVGPER